MLMLLFLWCTLYTESNDVSSHVSSHVLHILISESALKLERIKATFTTEILQRLDTEIEKSKQSLTDQSKVVFTKTSHVLHI